MLQLVSFFKTRTPSGHGMKDGVRGEQGAEGRGIRNAMIQNESGAGDRIHCEFQGLTESESLCFLAMVHSLHSSPQPRQCWSQPSPNPGDSTGQSVLLSLPYMDNEHLPISSPQVALCVCVCVCVCVCGRGGW